MLGQATTSNSWSGFKRLSSEQGGKEPKGINDVPHICLKCGAELTRGRDYYKKRHWDHAHKDEKTDCEKRPRKSKKFHNSEKVRGTPKRLMTALEGSVSKTPSKTPTSSTPTCDTSDEPSDTASHQKRGPHDDHSATSVQQSMESFITEGKTTARSFRKYSIWY